MIRSYQHGKAFSSTMADAHRGKQADWHSFADLEPVHQARRSEGEGCFFSALACALPRCSEVNALADGQANEERRPWASDEEGGNNMIAVSLAVLFVLWIWFLVWLSWPLE
jgi:hypothetical protein